MQMSLAEDDHVVETLPANESDHAFAVRFAVKPSPPTMPRHEARYGSFFGRPSVARLFQLQNSQLLPQGQVFQSELALPFEARSYCGAEGENQLQQARTGARTGKLSMIARRTAFRGGTGRKQRSILVASSHPTAR